MTQTATRPNRKPEPSPYIADAIPTIDGESVLFTVEIGSRVYGFRLDAGGNPQSGSEYITTPHHRNHHAAALTAAQSYLAVCPLDHLKKHCTLRAVRCGLSDWKYQPYVAEVSR